MLINSTYSSYWSTFPIMQSTFFVTQTASKMSILGMKLQHWLGGGGERWIRLIVGFQPLMVISPTASWIGWCKHWLVKVPEIFEIEPVFALRETVSAFRTDFKNSLFGHESWATKLPLKLVSLYIQRSLQYNDYERYATIPHRPRIARIITNW